MPNEPNLILIGMPGCGKSSIGKRVARLLGREFLDLDEMVVRRAGMSIPEIFARFGEARFRELERSEAEIAAARERVVIATGGGTIVQAWAPELFRRNGCVCYLKRPVSELETAHGRPLSKDREAVEKLFVERHEKYELAADLEIDNDADPETAAVKIAAAFQAFSRSLGGNSGAPEP